MEKFKRVFLRKIRLFSWPLLRFSIVVKHWVLAPYYDGLAVQARYLYRTSDLFRFRWEALGYDFAMDLDKDTGLYFMHKARQEHWYVRLRIFLDATLGRKPRPYEYDGAVNEEGEDQ